MVDLAICLICAMGIPSVCPILLTFASKIMILMMAKFILNRPDDSKICSRVKIIGIALKWYVLMMIGAMIILMICVSIYMLNGVNPNELTRFARNPSQYTDIPTWEILVEILVVNPFLDEFIFRLGLSFERKTVAIWAGLLPVVCAFSIFQIEIWCILQSLAVVGLAVSWLVILITTDEQWTTWRKRYIIPAMWITAIAFGLFHFRVFTVLTWQVFPFALATILVPLASGCALTYVRINLGFWWGVLFNSITNIPACLTIIFAVNN